FFQAEDGIRDFHVTGVQTCALPIFDPEEVAAVGFGEPYARDLAPQGGGEQPDPLTQRRPYGLDGLVDATGHAELVHGRLGQHVRSEERRVVVGCSYSITLRISTIEK